MPPNWPPPPPAPVHRNSTDVTISVVVLAMTALASGAASLFGLLALAFLDYCPPATCSASGAATAVMVAIAAVALFGITGLVLTVIRLRTRKRAWPFAVGTFGGCVLVILLGALAFSAAVS